MTGETERLSAAGRSLGEQGETLASYMGAQAGGGAHRFVADGIPLKNANAYSFGLDRPLSEAEQAALHEVGAVHGFPDVLDTGGGGVRLTNFNGAPAQNPAARDAFDKAIAAFSVAYADQTERDYETLKKAAQKGKLEVVLER